MYSKKCLVIFLLLVIIGSVSILLVIMPYTNMQKQGKNTSPGGRLQRRALIADGLYGAFPNDNLLRSLKELLERSGYLVKIVKGGSVTIDVFRGLTSYNLVILRLHGGYGVRNGKEVAGLFTGVRWTYEYYDLAKEGLVAKGIPFYAREQAYVALLPKFFKEELKGVFPRNSIIIAAGCFTALDRNLVKAFFSHGLTYYVGWRGAVTVKHMDEVLKQLVKLIVINGLSPEDAVYEVNSVLGPDPSTNEKVTIFTNVG